MRIKGDKRQTDIKEWYNKKETYAISRADIYILRFVFHRVWLDEYVVPCARV